VKDKGAEYIVILKKMYGTSVTLPEKPVFENEDYAVYRIDRH
jgi:hypothetical protein